MPWKKRQDMFVFAFLLLFIDPIFIEMSDPSVMTFASKINPGGMPECLIMLKFCTDCRGYVVLNEKGKDGNE
jgi:ribosomal protein L33